jgi:hypothetical protein
MTSLFIQGDLITYSVQLESVRIELQNSINTIGALPPYTYSSNLSSARITQIVTLINNVTNLMNTRRTHDINFFGRVIAVSNNYMEISRYSGFADVEAFLVENYVGTETLKNNL